MRSNVVLTDILCRLFYLRWLKLYFPSKTNITNFSCKFIIATSCNIYQLLYCYKSYSTDKSMSVSELWSFGKYVYCVFVYFVYIQKAVSNLEFCRFGETLFYCILLWFLVQTLPEIKRNVVLVKYYFHIISFDIHA